MALNLLIDTNVVVDSFLEREPFVDMSRRAISLPRRYNEVNNFISASTVTDIYYITYKQLKNHQTVRKLLRDRNPAVMDDGRNRPSHEPGRFVAGAAFFGYFLSPPKESNTNRTHSRSDSLDQSF